jgi:two-component system, OmpR family, sensor histidine kinase BaeS
MRFGSFKLDASVATASSPPLGSSPEIGSAGERASAAAERGPARPRATRRRAMLKLGITSKLFLALLVTSMLAVLATSIAARVSFVRGFIGYLNEQGIERIESVVPSLAATYEQHGSWDFLRHNPRAWFTLVASASASRAASDARAPNPPFTGRIPESELTDVSLRIGFTLRMALLDPERRFVVGNPDVTPSAPMRPIRVHGRVVGWIAVLPFQRVTAGAGAHLEDRQLVSTWIIGAGAVLLAAIVAVLLTHRLLGPIKSITAATHRLATGDYGTRLSVSSRDEIGRLSDDFNRLALALEKNEQMRRAFMADVSHELRTPLAVLRGELEAIEDGVRELTPEMLKALQGEVATLGKLVNDLYDLSLADIGALTYRMADVDVAELLRLRLMGFEERLRERRITLESEIPDRELIVSGDETRLQQLFTNLIENSIRYTNPGGRFRVCCRAERQQVVIELQDSEPGVPAELLPRLFDRFYRVDRSRSRESGGAGLGLAICKSIVEAHQGTITAQASPLGGLWISVTLPVPR